jgi:hypothetical protein
MAESRGRPRSIDKDKADQIVDAYLGHRPLPWIEETFGCSRGTIYWLLRRRGINANRQVGQTVPPDTEQMSLENLYVIICEQEQELCKLYEENAWLRKSVTHIKRSDP